MNNILLAIEITILGMGLVFAAILLLWWMMNLLTVLTADKETSSPHGVSAPDLSQSSAKEDDLKAQAAAVAVALALAEQQNSCVHPLACPPAAVISAWQLGMRTRQMSEKGTSVRGPLRKTG